MSNGLVAPLLWSRIGAIFSEYNVVDLEPMDFKEGKGNIAGGSCAGATSCLSERWSHRAALIRSMWISLGLIDLIGLIFVVL